MNTIRHIAAVGATAAVALLLAGCATPAAGPGATAPAETTTPTTSPEPTPTEAPTTEPTAEPTPTEAPADPTDVGSWLVTEDGIGPFTAGMSWDDAVAKATELGWDLQYAQPDPAGGCMLNVTSLPPQDGGLISVTVWGDANVVMDLTISDNGSPESDNPRPATAEGVTVHSAIDEVRAAYPGAMEDTVPIATDRFFLGVDADQDGQGIWFEWREGETQINTVSVNALGSPAYEHC
ncbi:hypothetical protein ACOKGD_04170 [Microbacterium phosphatis]|uniref:hypothetical protein n=1 Tax=Microbacterium phosphatis TaxID=3140248 RepID=UPI003140AFBE